MQLTRAFSGHIFQNYFNFEKSALESALETSPCACMRDFKRIKYFESLSMSCVTFLGMSRTCASMSLINFMQKTLTLMRYCSVDNFYI